jgi:hypothetical protein
MDTTGYAPVQCHLWHQCLCAFPINRATTSDSSGPHVDRNHRRIVHTVGRPSGMQSNRRLAAYSPNAQLFCGGIGKKSAANILANQSHRKAFLFSRKINAIERVDDNTAGGASRGQVARFGVTP